MKIDFGDVFASGIGWLLKQLFLFTLFVMMATGLWFFHQWQINRWAGEIAMLKAENAMRRAELEREFGTKSAGADELEFD